MNYIEANAHAGENKKIATPKMIENGEFLFHGKAFVEIGEVAEGGAMDYKNASSHFNVPYLNNHVVCKKTKDGIVIDYEPSLSEIGQDDWEIVE